MGTPSEPLFAEEGMAHTDGEEEMKTRDEPSRARHRTQITTVQYMTAQFK